MLTTDCPGIVSGSGAAVGVTPTVTASAYTAGYVMGGIMTFANVLAPAGGGLLESITLRFKGSAQTTEFDVAIFGQLPTGTFADHGAPAIASTDTAFLIGIYPMTVAASQLGTHTIYNLDNCGKFVGGFTSGTPNRNLYAVVTTKSAATPASTSDMNLVLAVVW